MKLDTRSLDYGSPGQRKVLGNAKVRSSKLKVLRPELLPQSCPKVGVLYRHNVNKETRWKHATGFAVFGAQPISSHVVLSSCISKVVYTRRPTAVG